MGIEILKIAALALCAVIIIGLVKNFKPEFGIIVALGCSIIIIYYIIDSLKYAFIYISNLYEKLNYGKEYLPIIIKVLAVAYITDFTSQLCNDAGEKSIGSKVELAGKIIIFIVSIPIFIAIFDLINSLL